MARRARGLYRDSKLNRRQRYEKQRDALWSERASFDSHWQELSNFIHPTRSRFWTSQRNQGGKRNQNIIDSTGKMAARTLSSGLHAGLTSPARPWFKLTTPDPDLATFKPVQEWLEIVTQRMQVIFSNGNLYNVLPTLYGDMGIFGTSAMSMLADTDDLFRCESYPIGSFAIAMNRRGIASTFVHDYEMSVAQVVEEFGTRPGSRDIDWSNISTTIKNLWDDGTYHAPVNLTWIVQPNEDADPQRIESKFLPFASCHFERGSNDPIFLRESGFRSFPVFAPRWEVTGKDSYGTDCPGMTALGDVKQLQAMHRDDARALKKMVDPAMVGGPELRTGQPNMLPGGVTYVRDVQHGFRPAHEIGLNIEHLERRISATQYRIQRAFYEDLFLMLQRMDDQIGADRPTAREIQERHEEKLIVLGPVLERTDDELLNPAVDRAYQLMEEADLIPPAPEELQGVKLKVEYTSILAQALKLQGVGAVDRFVASVLPMTQIYPEVRHKLKPFTFVDTYGSMLGVDPRLFRTDEEAQQLADAEKQQMQQQAEAQQAMAMARTAKDAAAAPMGTDSALDRVVGSTANLATFAGAPSAGVQ
jgi:hypothetical protein